jgi:hypothetical protein
LSHLALSITVAHRARETEYRGDLDTTVEIFNSPPTISISSTGLQLDGSAIYNSNVTLSATASDPDGTPVTLSWNVVRRPPSSQAIIGPTSGPNLNVQFRNETDFGTWEFDAIADDAQGETPW